MSAAIFGTDRVPKFRQDVAISAALLRRRERMNKPVRCELQLLPAFNNMMSSRDNFGPSFAMWCVMKTYWTTHRYVVAGASMAVALMLVACTSMMTRVHNADYLPRPNLTISLIDPSTVLVHHPAGTSRFTAEFGFGRQDTYPERRYEGFSRSRDVYGDGSVVLVPVIDGGKESTGMFVTLPSGRRFLFAQTSYVRDLRTKSNIKVFGLTNHKQHDSIAHFPTLEK